MSMEFKWALLLVINAFCLAINIDMGNYAFASLVFCMVLWCFLNLIKLEVKK